MNVGTTRACDFSECIISNACIVWVRNSALMFFDEGERACIRWSDDYSF